jgi:hypothetical protein
VRLERGPRAAFGAPDDSPRDVQQRGGRGAAGQHEAAEDRQPGIELVAGPLEPGDVTGVDPQRRIRRVRRHRVAQVRTDVE